MYIYALRQFFRKNTKTIRYFSQKAIFFRSFSSFEAAKGCEIDRGRFFPPGMGLQLLKNVQKYNFSVKNLIVSKLLPKIIKND